MPKLKPNVKNLFFIKKKKLDGSYCRKCADVEKRLVDNAYMPFFDQILVADESDTQSDGSILSEKYSVERAPFFLADIDGVTTVFTVYFKFVKAVFVDESKSGDSASDNEDLLDSHPDLSLL